MSKASKRQMLVKVAGIDGYFMTKTGGEITADTSKIWDGGSLAPDVLAGPAQAGNVTVTRGYDTDRDSAVIKRLKQMVGIWTTTISCTPTDRSLNAKGAPEVYTDCLLVSLTSPEGDAGGSDAQTFQLEFAVSGWQ